ncbi:MAG: hypothetical protein JST30_13990 [Armatimonadetes bacterium]|nr:hypothetical protein [Armatimonadota bacterium]
MPNRDDGTGPCRLRTATEWAHPALTIVIASLCLAAIGPLHQGPAVTVMILVGALSLLATYIRFMYGLQPSQRLVWAVPVFLTWSTLAGIAVTILGIALMALLFRIWI